MRRYINIALFIFFSTALLCAACAPPPSIPAVQNPDNKTATHVPAPAAKSADNETAPVPIAAQSPDNKTAPPDNKSVRRTEAMSKYKDVQDFIKEISVKYKLNSAVLTRAFDKSYFDYSIVELMDRPAEKSFWPDYSKRLISNDRINNGKKYITDNKIALDKAFAQWEVPPHVVTAIIGIESAYGKAELKRTAVTSLATLAFEYPRRAKYFRGELTNLFILAAREKSDPLSYRGSYAGAIGIPQFMPTSVLRYGKDGSGDGRVDIVGVHDDAIASVAFYLREHGWRKGKNTAALVTLKQSLPNSAYGASACDTRKKTTIKTLKNKGVVFSKTYPDNDSGILVRMEKDNSSFVPIVFFDNACPIHRYNPSVKYVAAVSLLAETLAAE